NRRRLPTGNANSVALFGSTFRLIEITSKAGAPPATAGVGDCSGPPLMGKRTGVTARSGEIPRSASAAVAEIAATGRVPRTSRSRRGGLSEGGFFMDDVSSLIRLRL